MERGTTDANNNCTVFLPNLDRSSPSTAALCNGFASHQLDFDDCTYAGWAHSSATIFPAALAAAEYVNASGCELVAGFIAGTEVQCAIGASYDNCKDMYDKGMWTTGVLGPIGAAAAVSRILNLSEEKTAHALALAGGNTGGLRGFFGSDSKAYENGRASQAGLLASFYADAGAHGALDLFENESTLGFSVLNNNESKKEIECVALGYDSHWHLVHPGINFKSIPTCSGPQAAAEAISLLVKQLNITSSEVKRVQVKAPDNVVTNAQHPSPRTAHEARFSLHWTVAATIRFGKVTLDCFEHQNLQDEEVNRLIRCIDLSTAQGDEAGNPSEQGAFVSIETFDGRYETIVVHAARGDAILNPMSSHDIDEKFRELTGHKEELLQRIRNCVELRSCRNIFQNENNTEQSREDAMEAV
eukprot:g4797.t1